MRRFEFTEGSSKKFWQIEQQDNRLVIAWGRLGAAGQSQVKELASAAAAAAELGKLVADKTQKGYAEVASVSACAPTAPAPKAGAVVKTAPAVSGPVAVAPAMAGPTVSATVAPAVAAGVASVSKVVWSAELAEQVDERLCPHRHSHCRPSPEHLAADPARALWAAWDLFRPHVPWAKLTVPPELKSAVEEARTFLEAQKLAPLSPMAAAVVTELCAPSSDPDGYPAMRGITEASCNQHGVGFLIDLALCATQVRLEPLHHQIHETPGKAFQRFRHFPRSVAPLEWGEDTARRLAFIAQNLPQPDYDALCQAATTRFAKLSYWEKLQMLQVIPGYTPLADALADEWLACDGHVEGHTPPSYSKDGVEPTFAFVYSRPVLVELAKKTLRRPFAGGRLSHCLWGLLDLVGADVIPLVRLHCEHAGYSGSVVDGLRVAQAVRGPEAAALFVSHLGGKKEAVTCALAYLRTNPELALPALADALATQSAVSDKAGAQVLELLRNHPGLLLQVVLRPAARTAVDKLCARMASKPEALPAELPPVLTNPPWLNPKKPAVLPVVSGVNVLPFVDATHDDEGLLALELAEYTDNVKTPTRWKTIEAQLTDPRYLQFASQHLAFFKKADVERAFREWSPEAWRYGHCVLTALAVLGPECLAGYPRIAVGNISQFAGLLADIAESPHLAGFFAQARTLKSGRRAADKWLAKFPKAAAVGLVPLAVGPHGKARQQAEAALRYVAQKAPAIVKDVAAAYPKPVEAAVQAVLSSDPREITPTKLPKLPAYCEVEKLPRPLLKGREKSLPKTAVEHLLTMLAFSTAEEPYAGLDDVQTACDPASLEDFSWALFNEWQMAGASAKESFCMQQLGVLGGDEVARKLTPLIRNWPGESLQARAVAGLEVLANIGSDLALMHLNGIAQKVKFKGLQQKAREKMDQVAQNRGLTVDELADRLVPDLDLDPDGSRTLDFGPRSFRVQFDETLRPHLVEHGGSGKVLSDLPKPNKADDAALAKEADATWKTLKKDAKAIAQNQITRLELAMCAQRRWEAASFAALFLEHPLLVHLARRLIFGVFGADGSCVGAFRVAEDSSLADGSDAAYALPATAQVGIAHPLELSEAQKAAFGQILGDYGIVQPFAQLGRDTYAPTAAEGQTHAIKRRDKAVVPLGKLLGLCERGWRKGAPEDAGWIWDLYKPLPRGLRAELSLETGIGADMQMTEAKQRLGPLTVLSVTDKGGDVRLSDLPKVLFSELVRDLFQLGSAP